MPTPEAKFWALLCMSCPCSIIRAHKLRQAHTFSSRNEGSVPGRMQMEIVFGIFQRLQIPFTLPL